jgi:hypothetical protein
MPDGFSELAPVFRSSTYSKSSATYGDPAGGGAGWYISSLTRSAGALPMMNAASTSALHSPDVFRIRARMRRLDGTLTFALLAIDVAFGLIAPPSSRGSLPSVV